ncbi:MAG: PD40 domain-containing protein [Bacteroidales bacterium]|nr:PD40 domain-containing protein [Bacteroidales bacterium]
MKKAILLIAILAISFQYSEAQKINKKKEFGEVHRQLTLGNYKTALMHANRLNLLEPSNANFSYLAGLCYYYSDFDKHKAIPLLKNAVKAVSTEHVENSIKEKSAPKEAWLILGKALHFDYQFAEAIKAFEKYKSICKDEKKQKEADLNISYCNNGIKMLADSIEISIYSLDNLNSEYNDHTPIINGNEDMLIFTSRRKGSTGNLIDNDGVCFEDIYVSYKEGKNWTEPKKISKNINTDQHEANVCLSPDGMELFIYKDVGGVGNLFHSYFDSIDWTVPKPLSSAINSTSNETHATFTSNTLYFTSDRKEGIGGKDIYISKRLPTGEWSLAENLGEIINSQCDEEGPFIHPDGHTLIFSSKCEKSMGGYDLFITEKQQDGSWSEPKNLGYPINTTGDDVFYVLSPDGKRAYYSSIQKGGKGGRDLFVMNLLSLPERSTVVINGVVRVAQSNEIPKDITITVTEVESNQLIGKYRPNRNTGKYTIILRNGKKYKLACEADNCAFKEEILEVPEDATYYELSKPIYLDPLGIIEK